jgi:four helix bundle protein
MISIDEKNDEREAMNDETDGFCPSTLANMGDSKTNPSLRERTMSFALRIIRLTQSLETNGPARVIGNQLLRSGTSVGAHWREGHRARSNAEFVSKLEVATQELDESMYWMELLIHSQLVSEMNLKDLMKEANELMSIFVASIRTAKASRRAT